MLCGFFRFDYFLFFVIFAKQTGKKSSFLIIYKSVFSGYNVETMHGDTVSQRNINLMISTRWFGLGPCLFVAFFINCKQISKCMEKRTAIWYN